MGTRQLTGAQFLFFRSLIAKYCDGARVQCTFTLTVLKGHWSLGWLHVVILNKVVSMPLTQPVRLTVGSSVALDLI